MTENPNPSTNRAGLTLESDSPRARVGTTIDSWELRVYLGSTETVDHYRAVHPMGGSASDLFVLRLDPDDRARFDAATAKARQIGHPNIATPSHAGLTGHSDERYAVVPVRPGPSLADTLPGSGFPAAEVARIGLEVLDLLEILHSQDITLGGLPLAAITEVQSSQGRFRIPGVFWLADGRFHPADHDALAPEGPTTPAADQFALGSLLRRLLAGTGRSAPTGTSDAMLDLVARLTRPESAERFPSWTPVRQRLENILAPPAAAPRHRGLPVVPLFLGGAILGVLALLGVSAFWMRTDDANPTATAPLPVISIEPSKATAPTPQPPSPPPPERAAAPRIVPQQGAPQPSVRIDQPVSKSDLSSTEGLAVPDQHNTEAPAPDAEPDADAPAPEAVPIVDPTAEVPKTAQTAPTTATVSPPESLPETTAPAFDPSPFNGRWQGNRAGRPVVVELELNPNGTLTGFSEVRIGSRSARSPLSGRWSQNGDSVQIDATETGNRPSRYTGTLDTNQGSGRVWSSGKDRGAWSLAR